MSTVGEVILRRPTFVIFGSVNCVTCVVFQFVQIPFIDFFFILPICSNWRMIVLSLFTMLSLFTICRVAVVQFISTISSVDHSRKKKEALTILVISVKISSMNFFKPTLICAYVDVPLPQFSLMLHVVSAAPRPS